MGSNRVQLITSFTRLPVLNKAFFQKMKRRCCVKTPEILIMAIKKMNEGVEFKIKKPETPFTDVKKLSSVEEKPKSHQLIPCPKSKKDPLPMKLRALPQSFWQQPNTSGNVSPTYIPPLDLESPKVSKSEVIGVENIELLFSLFQCVEHDGSKGVRLKSAHGMKVKRGRKKNKMKSQSKIKQDSDPYFTAAVIPFIPEEEDQILAQGQQVLAMISTASGDKNLSVVNSYSERLSDFVINL